MKYYSLRAVIGMTATGILLAGNIGCSGSISDDADGSGGKTKEPPRKPVGESACDDSADKLGLVPLRRLSGVEHARSVQDLVRGAKYTTQSFPHELSDRFENAAINLGSSDTIAEHIELTARNAAQAAIEDEGVRATILPCDGWDDAGAQKVCTDKFVDGFARRAFRRPLDDGERDNLRGLIETYTESIDYLAAIEIAISAVLQSPQFLYRVEEGDGEGRVTPFELATRMSYLFWQSGPDEALLAAAGDGELLTPKEIRSQAERMLADPRADESLLDFNRQWLRFDRIHDEPKNEALFPDWDDALVGAVREESDRFVQHVLQEEGGSVEALFTSRAGFVNQSLARHYGLDGVDDWTQVDLPAEERSGILTRANFLAGHSHQSQGSPILRGLLVTSNLTCLSFPAPPEGAANTPIPEPTDNDSNRDLFTGLTAGVACQACHSRIDGVGFGFEHYDAVGVYRSEDGGKPVDASGEVYLPDDSDPVAFGDAIELSRLLADEPGVRDCVGNQLVEYALARRTEDAVDGCLIERTQLSLRDGPGVFKEALMTLVSSPEFQRGVR